jgi:Fe-S-cluster containining protein
MINKNGFCYTFDESACASCNGACCIGESGYIWVDALEIKSISQFLNLDINQFGMEYLRKVGKRYSLVEVRDDSVGYACIFFDLKSGQCKIYPVRPKQCRTFPFWDEFKDKSNLEELKKECPGVVTDEKGC